ASQIKAMADAGYINGVSDTEFAPDSNITKLQCIALFSRAMGCYDVANIEILELAHEQYADDITACSLPWGDDEIAYMLYKGALVRSDLTTYIKGSVKNEDMSRGEAAIIITKAMGGEAEAKAASISLDYKDAASIPANIRPYVQYVTDQGIMNGIDDEFQASGTVTRAQMAVMLYRAVEQCGYSFVRGKFVDIDKDEYIVTVNADGEDTSYSYTDNTSFTKLGAVAAISEYEEDLPVVLQLSGDNVIAVDAISDQPEQTITAVYQGYSTLGGIYQIKIKESSTSSTVKTYTCIENVPITYQGTPATIKSLQAGDQVELELSNGKVAAISASQKSTTITGATITAFDIGDDGTLTMTISSSSSEYDGKTYPVASDAVAKKNNNEVALSSVYVGDKVTLTVKYGQIVSVEASSTYNTVTGTIVEVTISSTPSITVRVDGKEKTYQVPTNCDITVNQKSGSLYDFRVGDSVTLTTQSSAVTKIQVSTSVINTETGGSVNGTVAAVNTSYGFVSVLMEGYDMPIPVYKTSNSTTVITAAGKSMDFKSIAVGDSIECRGTTSNGAFVATLIIVTPAD
ncbi:MAG: S-layer homology domain-containing protein, partial [Candidatus Ornithomonoglobus sp.]